MLSTSHFKNYPAFWLTILLFVVIEILVRILPMEYTLGTAVYLTEQRRALADASAPEYDYLIFGGSRSLSLDGHHPSGEAPWSIYNLSMPAMDPRYFSHYFEKYMRRRSQPPAAVIFAGDIGFFQSSWLVAQHDPERRYSEGVDEPLWRYVEQSFFGRIEEFRESGFTRPPRRQSDDFNDMLWDFFSHRFLHLFSTAELARQYRGAERIFMVYESLPLLWHTWRFREGIRHFTTGFKLSHFRDQGRLAECDGSCDSFLLPQCVGPLPRNQDNRELATHMAKRNGQINLADRLTLEHRLGYLMIRDDHVRMQKDRFNKEQPDFTALIALIEVVRRHGSRLIISDVPSIDAYRDTEYHRLFFVGIEELERRYPEHFSVIRFPEPYYPQDLYIEQVHFDCVGAKRANRDFYDSVVPQIVDLAPPLSIRNGR